jgi:hypothetical protein
MTTECEEVADNLPLPPKGAGMEEARVHVRGYMPDESVVVIDNVAEALLRRASVERVPQRRRFETEAEARAFLAGIEYVNDSAITARVEGCEVVIEDEEG